MKALYFRLAFAGFFISSSVNFAAAHEVLEPEPSPARPLRIAAVDFPPFYINGPQGISGSLALKAKRIAELAGFKPELLYFPIKRMPQELADGKADIWMGVTNYEPFKDTTYIGTKPVFRLKLATWALGKNIKITVPEDLKTHTVILMYGYSYGGLAEQIKKPSAKFKYLEAKDISHAYRLLSNGRADILLNYENSMELWMKTNPRKRLRGSPFKAIDCFIVVSKKTLDAAEILKKLEAQIEEVNEDPSMPH